MNVSIITPVYNGAETLEHCLKSIHNQTHPHLEHSIIDGGSMDGTVEVIKRYENQIALPISALSIFE